MRCAVAVVAILVLGCGSPDRAGSTVVVFAASSFTEAFTELGDAFRAEHPDTELSFSFAGSGELAAQIGEGAPADVFVAADESSVTRVEGVPVPVARNTFEIIVEPGNPNGISGVDDLADPALLVVLCAPSAACGAGAAAVLDKAGVAVTPKSEEDKVKGVVAKVTAGEADAGIVFRTDVLAAGDRADGVVIPDDINVVTTASAISLSAGGKEFVDFLVSEEGQRILDEYGFVRP
jgi:molybdate transport system substrate-binding protein